MDECQIDLGLPRPKDDDLSWRVKDTKTGKWVDCAKPPYVTDVDQKTKGLVNFMELLNFDGAEILLFLCLKREVRG